MKRIWIDGYEANVPQRLGSSQVAFELLKNIEQQDFKNDYTVLLPDRPLEDLPKEREGFKYKILRPKRLWTRIALTLSLYLTKSKPDVFFSPTHYLPRFVPKGIKLVMIIFDLSFLHFPSMFKKDDLYKLTNWTKLSILHADHLITISNFTKKDLMANYHVDKKKITVVYPGYDKDIFHPVKSKEKMKKVLNKYGLMGDYLIYVGTIQPRKNLVRLIEVVARIEGLKLVMVGKTIGEGRQAWMFEDILNRPKKLGIEDRVVFLGFVETADLPYLISAAVALVQPSLWEGFGIPVVEAMATGTPVIVSNSSSLKEVVGDTGLLVDPASLDQIEQAIRTVRTDKKLRAKLSKQGLKHAKKFSWKKMTKQVIKILESV